MKKVALFYFLLSIQIFFCQNSALQKLNSDLKIATSDTVKINIFFKNAQKELASDPKKAISLFKEALSMAESSNNIEKMSKINTQLAVAYCDLNNYSQALTHDLEALSLAKRINKEALISICLSDVATVYFYLQNYPLSLAYALKALKLSEKLGNIIETANAYNTIGAIHLILNNYELSLKNFKSSLQLFIKLKDSVRIASTYDNISSVYSMQNKIPELLENAQMSLQIKEMIHDTIGIGYTYLTIGDAFYKRKSFDSALKYYTNALNIFIKAKELLGLAGAFTNVANVNFETGDLNSALLNVDQALKIAREMEDRRRVCTCYSFYVDIFEKKGNYKKAFEYQKLYAMLNDTLFNEDKNKQIVEMQTKYETTKKEEEITKLTQRSQILTQQNKIQQLEISRNWYLILGLGSFVLLILIVAFLLAQQNKLKASHTKMEVEQKLFRSQMNPHFIFNSLIAIQNYVYKHQPSEVADYISSFAKLMRMTLENSRKESVTIENELTFLTCYMKLQQLRFPNKFDFTIKVDPLIDIESILIPPMFSQPFVENAIEHGIMNKPDENGAISITFVQKKNIIDMLIRDNGIGRESAANNKMLREKKHQSLATKITEERLFILNKQNKQKFTLEIIDLKNADGIAAGTEVRISMPEL